MSDQKERIRGFLEKTFPKTRKIAEDAPLLASGQIDSLGILEVVTFLEKEFDIAITDEELLPENFACINSLCAFVQRKSPNGAER